MAAAVDRNESMARNALILRAGGDASCVEAGLAKAVSWRMGGMLQKRPAGSGRYR